MFSSVYVGKDTVELLIEKKADLNIQTKVQVSVFVSKDCSRGYQSFGGGWVGSTYKFKGIQPHIESSNSAFLSLLREGQIT